MQIGLSSHQAKEQYKKYGPNLIKETSRFSALKILLRQIKGNFLVFLLLAAAIISWSVGKDSTYYTILVVIVVIIGTGFIQEYKAEKAISSLKKAILLFTNLYRDGKLKRLPTEQIVPGDIIVLKDGERVPADCQIIEQKDLLVNESILTGEAKEVHKSTDINNQSAENADKLFMGTFIVSGKATAKVLHTGMNTEYGKIAKLISGTDKELPLQKKVDRIAKIMATVGISASIIAGLIMYFFDRGGEHSIVDILIVIIAMSVSAIPEGFPLVLTTALATGAYRMSKKNAIVNRMSTIETLGETTVICSDKTGTITTGKMTAQKILTNDNEYHVDGIGHDLNGHVYFNGKKMVFGEHEDLDILTKIALVCNDAYVEKEENEQKLQINGSATEAAILVSALKTGADKESFSQQRVEEIPFGSGHKMMSVMIKEGNKYEVLVKGALETILDRCSKFNNHGRIVELHQGHRDYILDKNNQYNHKGLRTVAFAYKHGESKSISLDNELIFAGIVGMEDAPKPEVKEAIKMAEQAKIKVKMITGDNINTANSIAHQIGLSGKAITGSELDEMSDEELKAIVPEIAIFARVRPEHKLRIVKALKARGEVVTMTGDGVNDSPALKEAHVGVAMGIAGTDVSRDVADLTLKDDNFATIVNAISEGRMIFNNIRKFITYQLSCNASELLIIFVAIILNLPLPLLALQILFLNLVTDDLPAISLAFNPASRDIMKVAPRRRAELITPQLYGLIFFTGFVLMIASISIYYSYLVLTEDITLSRTAGLLTLMMLQIANAFNFRSLKWPVAGSDLLSNRYLVYASSGSIIGAVIILYTPLNKVFETVPLGWQNWLISIVVSFVIIAVLDIVKNSKKYRFYR
ncbi:MAG: Calcium-transporting ATPase 1 [bacterium ADurb.Bin212]|nr:MAG: Calcium-transporting ATPase 1 [bacterium ADurb.Bin212]